MVSANTAPTVMSGQQAVHSELDDRLATGLSASSVKARASHIKPCHQHMQHRVNTESLVQQALLQVRNLFVHLTKDIEGPQIILTAEKIYAATAGMARLTG